MANPPSEIEEQMSSDLPRDGESKPLPQFQENNPNIVGWDDNDRENPANWCRNRKWAISLCLGLMTFVCTFASSVFSTATVATSELFSVSTEAMTLGVSLYVLVRLSNYH
jgi:DHA1 family multidrug resistance protein-like MFS transporter